MLDLVADEPFGGILRPPVLARSLVERRLGDGLPVLLFGGYLRQDAVHAVAHAGLALLLGPASGDPPVVLEGVEGHSCVLGVALQRCCHRPRLVVGARRM
ncbi:hypothetical protein HD597_004178 [Nonomuraea thailandensis]|uniref:Uncharacterized protein n=1 Tax=Nonomuraea thailandensis TaxID=1188745 RepID=A0A9X2K1N6_9ACTN|nr:hypothetical protein [Nonomuraea thailandensis]MCP2357158.1 hypothetical protein [Nonomuraea thailandensis]